jgi:hypothetical protein
MSEGMANGTIIRLPGLVLGSRLNDEGYDQPHHAANQHWKRLQQYVLSGFANMSIAVVPLRNLARLSRHAACRLALCEVTAECTT